MNEIPPQEMRQIQLQMLAVFHNVCKEQGLRYYLAGGTMLGAVRHRGFIPWDDDIDVAMPRADYETLLKKAGGLFPGSLSLRSFRDAEFYQYGFAKLIHTRTLLAERVYPRFPLGVYLDVFPLDGCPQGEERNLLLAKLAGAKRLIGWYLHNKHIAAAQPLTARIIKLPFVLGTKLALNPTRVRVLFEKITKELEGYPFDQSETVFNAFGAWGMREIMPRACYGEPTPVEFEGHSFYGVADPHAYLTALYGDYHQLPPEEKRVSHHDCKVWYREGYSLGNCFD